MKTSSSTPKILAVDDSEGNLVAIEATLEALEAQVVKASSGEEALAYALRDHFAVILLDVHMPGMDGFETARLIRGIKRTSAVPVIFITGSLGEQGIFRGYESGAVDYLLKPYQPEILRSKVKVFIDLFKQSQELIVLQELQVTQQVLADRNQELLDFISAAFHDFREPIRQLGIFCELLTEPDDSGDVLRNIQSISKTLLAQNDRLRAYARLLTETQPFSCIQLGSLIETLVEHLQKEIEQYQGHVEVRDLPEIMGDPTQIQLLFQILLENALQYARPSVPPYIRIEAEPDNTITVYDNGRGVDEVYLASIMRPFKRLVTENDVRGAGLGLSLAKRIVEFHGGELSASSEPGQGSQFRIRFPHRENQTASPVPADGPRLTY